MTARVSQELLDVVDFEDRVTGVKMRGEVHAQGLMHRAVHVLVFNSAGQLFLQKRSMTKDESPGQWDTSAAGHVDSGETYLECAVRELAEELGELDALVSVLDLLMTHRDQVLPNGHAGRAFIRERLAKTLILQKKQVDRASQLISEALDILEPISLVPKSKKEELRLLKESTGDGNN